MSRHLHSDVSNAQPSLALPNRREMLSWATSGLAGAALASLFGRDHLLAGVASEADDPPPHHTPKAKRAIHIFCCGGLSQVDSFDYKPELIKYHGKKLPGSERPDVFFGQVGLLHQPCFEFHPRGDSGLWISDLFPHLSVVADEMLVVRSMFAETSNHTPATFQANTGFRLN
ncbi:MAG TPA: DUF1501 domain-containing protein, partial [Pirellulales bacterium]|nr:DUF1501 domain-containing protein [Pirellulales bacterium]